MPVTFIEGEPPPDVRPVKAAKYDAEVAELRTRPGVWGLIDAGQLSPKTAIYLERKWAELGFKFQLRNTGRNADNKLCREIYGLAPVVLDRGVVDKRPVGPPPGAKPKATGASTGVASTRREVLACLDPQCEYESETTATGKVAMRTHTMTDHGRPATADELRPVPA